MYALSIHADYRCRHSGACCSADWDVPVEAPIYRSLSDAVARRALRVSDAAGTLDPFVTGPDLPDEAAAMIERTESGHCVFLDRSSRLCIVHRDLGESALPLTCRHFPRLAVRDGRGTFITLSHFCPTAAGMLFREDVPLEIVTMPAAFPEADYDGLAVGADDLPPLLHARMLMDLDGYGAWEAHMIARCADGRAAPESIVATLARDAGLLASWIPGSQTLREAVGALPQGYVPMAVPATIEQSLERHAGVMRAVPSEWRPEPDETGLASAFSTYVAPAWDRFRVPLSRFLAAKAFASWTAYQGRGIAAIVAGLDAALGFVRVEAARACRDAGRRLDAALLLAAIRHTDFALNHLASGDALADEWSRYTGRPDGCGAHAMKR